MTRFSDVKFMASGVQKQKYKKNSPEINELERDLFPAKFLSSNFEKTKR